MKLFYYIILFFSISLANLFAQSSSTYTRYGLGDIEYSYSARMAGLGNLGTALVDPNHILTTNPAGWFALNRTRIEFTASYNGVQVTEGEKSAYYSETQIKGFTLAFPISEDYGVGVAAGLIPYSRISYKAIQNVNASDGAITDYTINYEGSGGLSKFFVGSSVKLPLDIYAGVAFEYYFGTLNYFSKLEFAEQGNLSANFQKSYKPTGFGSTVGLLSPNLAKSFGIDIFTDLRAGASFNYISNLDTDTLLTAAAFFKLDTIGVSTVKMHIPTRLNAGISFVFDDSYNVLLDFVSQSWSNYKLNDKADPNLRDAMKITGAFEFKPKFRLGQSFWEQIIWRAGLSFEQTPYTFKGTGIDQYSVYAGFSLPMGLENSVDLAFQYSRRGTTENNLLKEDQIKVFLGLSFGELWFQRYEK